MTREEYSAYLKSEHWQQMRRLVWRDARGRCEHCGATGDHVHHKTYERLGHERREDLELLCDRCHRDAHGIKEKTMNEIEQELEEWLGMRPKKQQTLRDTLSKGLELL